MAKYLQDIYIYYPLVPRTYSKEEEEKFNLENKDLWSSLKLIEDLYNFNLPKKYTTHDGLWRLDIVLKTYQNLDLLKEGKEDFCYVDVELLKTLDKTARKIYLFDKVSHQLINYLKESNYSYKEFETLNRQIIEKGIKFNEPYRKEKLSPDRKNKAFIWAEYDEFEKATYVKVLDKNEKEVLYQKIDNQHFSNFKSIKWQDNFTINIFEINTYSIPKQFEDYYEINLNGNCNYRPITREANFHYGLKLIEEKETFEKGLGYIKIAAELCQNAPG